MANDKDFLLKNAVEVGGSTKVTLGTITSSDIDLSTGNYFSDTLAANTTYTISNAGDVQSFQLEVTGGFTGYVLSNANYDNKSFSVNSQDTSPYSVAFKTDGTKMYIVGITNDTVYQYSLSTAWDVSTASYDSVSFSVNSQEANPYCLRFKTDGTKMYVLGPSGDDINEYTLSTAWDLSTTSYTQTSASTGSQDASPSSFFFKSDGTKVYIVGLASDAVHQYSLSTAWDVSTLSYDSVSFSVSSQETNPFGLSFNSDGSKMYVVGNNTDNVYQYSLSTAWDVSTASYDGISFSVNSQDTSPVDVVFSPDGDKMYIMGNTGDSVDQYSTTTDTTLTWPSSIEWAGGVAPAAPAAGETDLFTITTDDGGTTYVGVKTADNLS